MLHILWKQSTRVAEVRPMAKLHFYTTTEHTRLQLPLKRLSHVVTAKFDLPTKADFA